MVSRDHRPLEALQARDALARLGPVADAVAERPDGVDRAAGFSVADGGLEGRQVGVDVRHDEGTGHRGEYSEWALV